MRKHHVRFNKAQLRTETVPYTTRDYVRWFLGRAVLFAVVAFSAILIFDQNFESPKVRSQERQISFLESQLATMENQVVEMSGALEEITERDEIIYRNIFGADPYPEHLRNPGIGGADRYRELRGLEQSERVIVIREEMAELERRMVAQGESFNGLLQMAENQEAMLKSIPAIQPVRNSDLKRMASGYGYRIHPIYKVRKMHWGMDFSAPTGTEIFATGDGKVVEVKKKYNGYGYHIKIRHGFGYETLYAHMSKILVKKGQRVERGEVVGLVGSTGTSVAPHLHYEVFKEGQRVNPAHYYFNDLSPAQYEQLLEASSYANQSFD
jgi:hypothetical protein